MVTDDVDPIRALRSHASPAKDDILERLRTDAARRAWNTPVPVCPVRRARRKPARLVQHRQHHHPHRRHVAALSRPCRARGAAPGNNGSTDPLTGLTNRREFPRLAAENSRRSSDSTGWCLILGDIDHFKHINDSYGHDAGDNVLVAVCEQLQAVTRGGDVVARWGGGEFIMLLPDTDLDTANRVAERARNTIDDLIFVFAGRTISTSITFDVHQRQRGDRLEDGILRADEALRHGKQQGKNRVECSCGGKTYALPVTAFTAARPAIQHRHDNRLPSLKITGALDSQSALAAMMAVYMVAVGGNLWPTRARHITSPRNC